jgi:hypothetical protein
MEGSGSGLENPRLKTVGIRCAEHATPLCPQKLALTLPNIVGSSVGIVRLPTNINNVFYDVFIISYSIGYVGY